MSRKIRLIVNAVPMTYVQTGVGRYLRNLYLQLEQDFGHELDIVYFDGHGLAPTMPTGPENMARWSRVSSLFWKLPALAAFGVRVGMQLRRDQLFRWLARGVDLYHEAAFFPFLTPPGVRTVFTVHDMTLARLPETHPRERVMYFNRYFWRRLPRVARFLTVSDFTRRELIELCGVAPERVRTTHLACEGGFWRPRSQAAVRSFRARRGLPEEYFLFVGSGDPRKNLSIIPPALEAAGLAQPLVVIGWEGWAQPPGNVRMLGYVSDEELACAYSGALALVFPSLYEGFGLPLVEAMACGCPLIVSGRTSLPEVAGDAALYFDEPRSVEVVAAQLRRAVEDISLRQELSARGLAQSRRFDWKTTAAQTYESFALALGG